MTTKLTNIRARDDRFSVDNRLVVRTNTAGRDVSLVLKMGGIEQLGVVLSPIGVRTLINALETGLEDS